MKWCFAIPTDQVDIYRRSRQKCYLIKYFTNIHYPNHSNTVKNLTAIVVFDETFAERNVVKKSTVMKYTIVIGLVEFLQYFRHLLFTVAMIFFYWIYQAHDLLFVVAMRCFYLLRYVGNPFFVVNTSCFAFLQYFRELFYIVGKSCEIIDELC
jgi:hypothetical protein